MIPELKQPHYPCRNHGLLWWKTEKGWDRFLIRSCQHGYWNEKLHVWDLETLCLKCFGNRALYDMAERCYLCPDCGAVYTIIEEPSYD